MIATMPSWDELKCRKIVQWTLAYLAGAWVVLQLVDILASQFAWPAGLVRGITILLAVGFFVALVLAWYHGEQGRQRVSGPELLMVAALLLMAGAAIAMAGGSGARTTADAASRSAGDLARETLNVRPDSIPSRSIAVLPLDDHSADPRHAYFAAAMTEEITSALAKVPELRVSARNSAAKFPESGLTVGEFVTGELGVAYALEGSVQREGERARITVQLIDARTEDDEHVWSRSYDVDLVDVLDVQVRIARDVAARLAATFTEAERARIEAGATDDPLAYELYLRASRPGRVPSLADRRGLLRETVARDPGFSLAWASLAEYHFFERFATGDTVHTDSIRLAFDRAIETAEHPVLETRFEARRALMLDEGRQRALALLTEVLPAYPSDPDLMMDVATVHWYAGRMAEEARWTRRAMELDPLNTDRANRLAWLYIDMGLDDDAREVLDRAMRIDPGSGVLWDSYSGLHQINGRRAEARAAVDSLYARDDPDAALIDGAVRVWFGDVEGAYEIFRSLGTDDEDIPWWAVGIVAHTALVRGDSAYADRLLTTMRRRIENLPPDPVVTEHLLEEAAIRGGVEESVEALKRYVAAGGRESRWIRRDPIYSGVRSAPRFEAELRRLERIVEGERRQARRDLREGR